MKMNKRLMRLSGVMLSASFLVSCLGVPALAADSLAKMEKNETVYIITDAAGTPDSVIVSDWLKNGDKLKELKDSSNLSDIEVIKGDATYSGSGKTITWAAGGDDVYYRGTSKQELPVGVSMTYLLDGKEISAADLAGKSGKLTIKIKYTNSTKQEVAMPLLKPTMVTCFILQFMTVWSDFLTPLYLSSKSRLFPMTMAVYQFFGKNKSYWNYIFADIVLTCIPVIIVYMIGQKYIVGGMTSGAVKE